jgi:hypothetical protein
MTPSNRLTIMEPKVEPKVEPQVEPQAELKVEPKGECKAECKVAPHVDVEGAPRRKKQRRSADRVVAWPGLLALRKEAHESYSGAWCRWCPRPHVMPTAVFRGKLSLAIKK